MSAANGNEIFVKNPHSILPAIQMRPRDVLEVTLPRDKDDDTWKRIEDLAYKNRIPIRDGSGAGPQSRGGGGPSENSRRSQARGKDADRARGDHKRDSGGKDFTGRESSHGALIRPKPPISIEEMFEDVSAETRGVWLALDCLQDPQNLGAIFRSAGFFGVRGIIMTQERSAPMSYTVYDISSGGVEAVPFVSIINLQHGFEVAKESGLWILGTSEHAKEPIQKIKNDRPWLLVMGNEEKGIRRLTEEACDMMCTIPSRPNVNGQKIVTSMNVSVATGVLLSHLS